MTTLNKPILNAEIVALNPKQLLDGTQRYLIPMYQRNYAWGPSQIEQLIIDILDAQLGAQQSDNNNNNKTYYLGTLVVFEKPKEATSKQVFEVIDGQQRFTTLTILMIYLKKYFDSIEDSYMSWYQGENIEFESRPKSSEALTSLLLNDSIDDINNTYGDLYNSSILSGYKSITEIMQNKFNHLSDKAQTDKADLRAFCEYLFNNVQIARVPVPNETDLNHYFEVMNNRGEQLEKHEIIKARLMAVIEKATESEMTSDHKTKAKSIIHDVWEACANMNKYVQYGFNTTLRSSIFSENLTCLNPESFEDLLSIYEKNDSSDNKQQTITEVPKPTLHNILFNNYYAHPANPDETADNKTDNNDDEETYYSLVNFSNFLLHVLRIMVNEQSLSQHDIALDDKQLLPQFEKYVLNTPEFDKSQQLTPLCQVKTFIYNLLKTKFVFDHFIIKRNTQDTKRHWTLEKLTKNINSDSVYYKNSFEKEQGNDKDNDKLVMLQSALHVSTPTMNYKHWLNATLYYLYQNYNKQDPETGIKASDYLQHLEAIARNFMLRRFLTNRPDGYHHIIYKTSDIDYPSLKLDENISKPNAIRSQIETHLSYRNIRSVFIFNYLDYLIWLQNDRQNFIFTSRSSIEHFYPQNPINATTEQQEQVRDIDLNRFGNLCLISHGLNSRVSNHVPVAKKQFFEKEFATNIDSLKLYKMIEMLEKHNNEWNLDAIIEHENEMFGLLEEALGIKIKEAKT